MKLSCPVTEVIDYTLGSDRLPSTTATTPEPILGRHAPCPFQWPTPQLKCHYHHYQQQYQHH